MPSLSRACDRDAAENLEDVDVRASRFAGRRCAAGSGHAWLHDRRQAPRRASTLLRGYLKPGEKTLAVRGDSSKTHIWTSQTVRRLNYDNPPSPHLDRSYRRP